jgi:2-phospho-L-lactate transferase/gluconeogenesis factor (CofD/UPF0052 family)
MQKGETEGFDAQAHIDALFAHCGPRCVDVVVLQSPTLQDGVPISPNGLAELGIEVVEADVASAAGSHDPARLAAVLRSL